MRTVDTLPSAGDSRIDYGPQESPANGHIEDGAGDAVGTSRGPSGKTNAIAFSAVQPHRLEVFKAASNAFIAAEQGLGDLGPIERWPRPSKRLLRTSSPGRPGLL